MGGHWNRVLFGSGWIFCEGFFIAYNMQTSLYISKILLEQILEIFFFSFQPLFLTEVKVVNSLGHVSWISCILNMPAPRPLVFSVWDSVGKSGWYQQLSSVQGWWGRKLFLGFRFKVYSLLLSLLGHYTEYLILSFIVSIITP